MAWVVQKIFQMAADGIKVSEIARCLNEMEVPTKYLYHRAKGENFPCIYGHTKMKLWDCSMISKTIKNQVYLGKLVWNQSKCGLDTGKKTVRQPEKEWIVYENHHEALVTQEVFDKANRNIIPSNSSRKGIKKQNWFFFADIVEKVCNVGMAETADIIAGVVCSKGKMTARKSISVKKSYRKQCFVR